MAHRVALVSCVKSKLPKAAPAGDLYTSALFRGLRGYAEAVADEWYILSAEHGVLRPEQIIAPYERTLNGMPRERQRAWADRVNTTLRQLLAPGCEIVMLAGLNYRRDVVPLLQADGHAVRVPFEGVSFGKQLQRLKQLSRNGYNER